MGWLSQRTSDRARATPPRSTSGATRPCRRSPSRTPTTERPSCCLGSRRLDQRADARQLPAPMPRRRQGLNALERGLDPRDPCSICGQALAGCDLQDDQVVRLVRQRRLEKRHEERLTAGPVRHEPRECVDCGEPTLLLDRHMRPWCACTLQTAQSLPMAPARGNR